MKAFLLSLQSEFFKTRKTLAFWSAIILPLLICTLVFIGFFVKSDVMSKSPGMLLWLRYMGSVTGIMGSLILPIFVMFIAYSINGIEHRSDTWKSMFSLPVPKLTIYSAKYLYTVFLIALTLALFASLTLLSGNLLNVLKPEMKFNEYSISALLCRIYVKLFLAALGILSIQFLLSLIWSDILKPLGIGFCCFIGGVIAAGANWDYAWTIPYAHPLLALKSIPTKAMISKNPTFDLLTKEVWVSLSVAAVMFVLGYFVVSKRSVK